jgi:putative transposase
MERVMEIGGRLGIRATCDAFGVVRSSYYRWLMPKEPRDRRRRGRALSSSEREAVLDVLHADGFIDLAPGAVFARLLDLGTYLCSERTMYRILAENEEVKERRDQLRHPGYSKPELLATGPNELWSWDITKLLGPAKWRYYYLYVILDVFSRYVVGWMVAYREAAALASRLIEASCRRQGIEEAQLTLHADRGSSMKSKTVALLLSDLGVVKSHSRPHVSNDNPYSESQFKTMKYRPEFPRRFGCLEDARAFCVEFFRWYNMEHYHGGLGLMTPHDVHYGLAEARRCRRAEVLSEAYARHPERFVRGMPTPPELPREVWINKPVGNGSTNITRQEEIVDPGAFMEVVSEVRGEIAGVAH